MSDKRGFYKIARKTDDHWLWTEKRVLSRWEAWEDMIREAAWADHQTLIQGKLVTVRRGEIPHSERTLAARWRWSAAKTHRFLNRLKTEAMVKRRAEQGVLLLVLVNYELYQGTEDKSEAAEKRKPQQQRGSSEAAAKQTEEDQEDQYPPKAPHGGAGEGISGNQLPITDYELRGVAAQAVAACGLDFESEAGRIAGELGIGLLPARKKLLACCLYAHRQDGLHSPGKLAQKRARNGGVDDQWLRLAHEQLRLPSGWVFRGTCGACGKSLIVRKHLRSREDYRDCPDCGANVDLERDESVGFWDY